MWLPIAVFLNSGENAFSEPWRGLAWCLRLYWLLTPKMLLPDLIIGCYKLLLWGRLRLSGLQVLSCHFPFSQNTSFFSSSLCFTDSIAGCLISNTLGHPKLHRLACLLSCFFALLGIEPRTLRKLSKCSIPRHTAVPQIYRFSRQFLASTMGKETGLFPRTV